ncbi:hypothetical protein [Mesorhizobium sp. B1-1-8]|uniref:hypothetical protein n=1 Tax=Mesorhizobium sp. B1-1-8 TaxID=2589976 RepID=UPI00112A7FB2|nr:hypothetical protein [Mesorhizobium sp. B1-1-8]UCI10680.1 hypothetical protein FJ974_28325 [Mesorhizobium sp. B1-1-8]
MIKVLAVAILSLGLATGAMAQTSGGSGNNSNANAGNSNNGSNSANTAGTVTTGDQSGAVDKCKTGANGKTTTTDPATTKQEAKNCN